MTSAATKRPSLAASLAVEIVEVSIERALRT